MFYFHSQIKAEYERILSERNVVRNLVETTKRFNKKILIWQPKSSNKNMKCLISDMGIMMSEEPETKSGTVITCHKHIQFQPMQKELLGGIPG